jgi:ATP-dependent Lhr-like helicase
LVRVLRRLEARGEIPGGRFIAGVSSEQFALPEAITALRQARRRPYSDSLLCLAALDPANLLGTVLPSARVPRVVGAKVVIATAYRSLAASAANWRG